MAVDCRNVICIIILQLVIFYLEAVGSGMNDFFIENLISCNILGELKKNYVDLEKKIQMLFLLTMC